jgi:S-adenosylmethionine decarboxylase proenzyme
MDQAVQTIDYDSTLRLYNLDLRHKVRGVWDENIPLINHTVIEVRGLNAKFINSSTDLKSACDKFCSDVGLSVVERRVHNFKPIGKTIFYVLEESHLSMHTWPESGYIHLDLVTCSKDEITPLEIATIFNKHFKPSHIRHIKLRY